jgi:hypothetical protein
MGFRSVDLEMLFRRYRFALLGNGSYTLKRLGWYFGYWRMMVDHGVE